MTSTSQTRPETPSTNRLRIASSSPRRISRAVEHGRPAPAARDPRALIAHDLRHELSTVAMLASALSHSGDVGPAGRHLATQLVQEMQRLDELTDVVLTMSSTGTLPRPITFPDLRLDEVVLGVIEPIRLTSRAAITVRTTAVVVRHDRLALWRALRNVVCNALAAVGGAGRVDVRLTVRERFAIIDVDDDGPGMSDEDMRDGAAGLSIIGTLAVGWGGWFEVGASSLGGCRIRLVVPLNSNVG